MKQSEIVKQLTDKELMIQVIFSQLVFITISIISSFLLFEHFTDWLDYFSFNDKAIIYYGVIPALIVVSIDIILSLVLPKHLLDDGGINEKLFKTRTVTEIIFIAAVVAIAEELLFRGVIQTTFGFIIASVVFTLVHIRYLKKPVLLISVLILSFYLGYAYEVTGNLLVTITAHFIIDLLLGLFIRFQK